MSLERLTWLRRIKAAEREYVAARLAAERLLDEARHEPKILRGHDLILRDVRIMSTGLEGTYLIRLFAEFEAALREYWPTKKSTPAPSRTRDLLDGVSSACRISSAERQGVHEVRELRNALVHQRQETLSGVAISEARHRLCEYLKYLPPNW